jgi:hypothetical protein
MTLIKGFLLLITLDLELIIAGQRAVKIEETLVFGPTELLWHAHGVVPQSIFMMASTKFPPHAPLLFAT